MRTYLITNCAHITVSCKTAQLLLQTVGNRQPTVVIVFFLPFDIGLVREIHCSLWLLSFTFVMLTKTVNNKTSCIDFKHSMFIWVLLLGQSCFSIIGLVIKNLNTLGELIPTLLHILWELLYLIIWNFRRANSLFFIL